MNKFVEEGLVKELRKTRDEMNQVRQDMTFEEEHAYLDSLINDSKNIGAKREPQMIKGKEKSSVQ